MDDITRSVLEIAIDLADVPAAGATPDPDSPLSELGLGSLHVVRLMRRVEERFAVSFPADAITGETFRSARTVADVVRQLNPGRPAE